MLIDVLSGQGKFVCELVVMSLASGFKEGVDLKALSYDMIAKGRYGKTFLVRGA